MHDSHWLPDWLPGQGDDVTQDAEHLVDAGRLVDALKNDVEQVAHCACVRRPRDTVIPPIQQPE